jgi:predicted amidohydrolase
VGVVQFNPKRGGPSERDANLTRLAALAEGALREGAKLVVLPEMAASGYRFPDAGAVRPLAERAAEGPTASVFGPLAAAFSARIVVGFPEDAGDGRLFNSALVLGPDGRVSHVYRKRLLYTDDHTWAAPGDTPYPVFPTGFPAPFDEAAVGICMDLNDDRFTAWLGRRRPGVLCFPTNWIDQGLEIHGYWAWRLRGWAGLLLAADRWGSEDGVGFWGRSAILDMGRRPGDRPTLAASAPAEGDGWLVLPQGRH